MKREIILKPAFDKRNPDPSKNYGIHGVEMLWILKGKLGAITFCIFTNWHLPHVEKELDRQISKEFLHLSCHPQPADVSYHALGPKYEGQESRDCDLVEGGKCYCDGSGLAAERIFDILVEQGSDAVWTELETVYKQRLGDCE